MQYVANHLPISTGITRDAARHRKARWTKAEFAATILANLFCTVCFSWLLIWLAGEMWQDLMK